jgi:hypothetical protein
MLVVTTLMLLGLLSGIVASQLRGYRLGGVIIVPLFAIYTLRSFGTFPVLVLSVVGAYLSVWIVKQRSLLYGRSLFVIAVLTGGLVPLFVFAFTTLGFGPRGAVSELGFIGSVLPGIAAYNFHRVAADRRILDAVWSMVLLLFLVVVGIGLVLFVGLTPLSTATPAVLLAPQSDIARAFGLVVDSAARPVLLPFPKELGLLGLGLGISEGVRKRWGLRIGGVIVLPLMVLFAFRNQWLLVTYLLSVVPAYAAISALHSWTLIYGRVLLSMAVIFGLLMVLSLTAVIQFDNGLLPFFTGILGGVGAYNTHAVAPAERRSAIIIATGTFVVLAAVARGFLTPLDPGILHDVQVTHLLASVFILALAAREAHQFERIRPRDFEYVDLKADAGTTTGEQS